MTDGTNGNGNEGESPATARTQPTRITIPARARFPIGETCDLLGCDRSTLHHWLEEAGITPHKDPTDRRARFLTRDEIRTLAERHDKLARLEGGLRERREQGVGISRDREVAQLQRRMGAIETSIASLAETMQRLAEAVTAEREREPAPSLLPERVYVPIPASLPPRPPARHDTTANRLPRLPDGWLSVAELAARHRVPDSSARRWVRLGQWPTPHAGQWASGIPGTFPILTAYDAEQQAEVARLMAERDAGADAE